MMNDLREFDNFPDAFAYCRRKDVPVVVRVERTLWKLYPSGVAKAINEYIRPDSATEKEPA